MFAEGVLGQGVVNVELVGHALSWLVQGVKAEDAWTSH